MHTSGDVISDLSLFIYIYHIRPSIPENTVGIRNKNCPQYPWLVVGGDLWNSSSRSCVIGGIGEEIPFPA